MDPAREPAPSVVRQLEELAGRLHRRLIAEASEATASSDRDERIGELISRAAPLLDAAGRARLHEAIDRLACGLGPLEPLLADPEVDEILVMGTAPVFVERCGRLAPAGVRFADEATLRGAIDRILGPAGRRVDESSPFCDARLPDGSRVNVVIPPLAVDGPVLTIRRFRSGGLTAKDLESSGTWPPRIGALLAEAIRSRANVLVSGGTGSGKTTTLGALADLTPAAVHAQVASAVQVVLHLRREGAARVLDAWGIVTGEDPPRVHRALDRDGPGPTWPRLAELLGVSTC